MRVVEERGSADKLESGSTSFAGIQTCSWHSSCRREPKTEIKTPPVIKKPEVKKPVVKTKSYTVKKGDVLKGHVAGLPDLIVKIV